MNNTQIRPHCIFEKIASVLRECVLIACCSDFTFRCDMSQKRYSRADNVPFSSVRIAGSEVPETSFIRTASAWFLKENKLKLFWHKTMFPLFSQKGKISLGEI